MCLLWAELNARQWLFVDVDEIRFLGLKTGRRRRLQPIGGLPSHASTDGRHLTGGVWCNLHYHNVPAVMRVTKCRRSSDRRGVTLSLT